MPVPVPSGMGKKGNAMGSGSRIGYLLISLVTVIAASAEAAMAQTAGSSPFAPANIGVALAGIIECGRRYTSHELYDMKITLSEVVRGEEAWKRLKGTSASNKPADACFEYILARVSFEYFARGAG
jgi:hypothetical protein